MQIGANHFGQIPKQKVWVRGEILQFAVISDAVKMYKDSDKGPDSEKETEADEFRDECITKAFNQIMTRKEKGYIEIVPTGELTLKEEGRIEELMDMHEKDPNSLSGEDIEFGVANRAEPVKSSRKDFQR